MFLISFSFSNRVFTEGTCKLLNLVISDLVDEDFVQHNREHAASAVLFGMSALLSKPGQTLAPLIGTWLLAVYTGGGSSDIEVVTKNFKLHVQALANVPLHFCQIHRNLDTSYALGKILHIF